MARQLVRRPVSPRLSPRRYTQRRRLLVEFLERRNLLATFNVNVFNDELDPIFDVDDLSLREAIREANNSPGPDTIQLPDGTYSLTLTGANEDLNATGDLDITEGLTIIGVSGARDNVIVSGNLADRVFDYFPNSPSDVLRIENLTVSGGLVDGLGNINATPLGGGIAAVSGSLTLSNVIVRDNSVTSTSSISNGGGVYATVQTFQMQNSLILSNTARDDGGGLYVQAASVAITGSTIQSNQAGLDGGGAFLLNPSANAVDIFQSTFIGNDSGTRSIAGVGTGGGLSINALKTGGPGTYVPSDLTITQSTFRNNDAFDSGGGIYAIDSNLNLSGSTFDGNTTGDAGGGAIFEYDQTDPLPLSADVSTTFFANNTSVNGGGGLLFREVTAVIQGGSFTGNRVTGLGNEFGDGGGALTLTSDSPTNNRSASVSGALFDNNEAASAGAIAVVNVLASLSNLTISNNRAVFDGAGGGGAIGAVGVVSSSTATLTLTDSIVSGNTSAGAGAGGIGLLRASAEIVRSEITNNSATNTIPNPLLGVAGVGGGIGSVGEGTLADIKIAQSLIANNTAVNGGGIFAFDNDVVIENSTLSGNSSSGNGESIINAGVGTFNLTQATVVQSAVPAAARIGVINQNSAADSFTWYSSLIESSSPSVVNGTGTFNSSGFNLDSDGSLGLNTASDQNNVSAQLLPLANNGGTTRTHALQSTSPAIDRADPASFIIIDQRGVTRPINGDGIGAAVNDIGAFEAPSGSLNNVDLAITLTGSAATAIPGATFTYTVTVNNAGPIAATGVVVTDTLPAGLTFVSGNGTGVTVTNNAGVVTASLGTLAAGASRSFTIVVSVASSVTGTIANSVNVSSTETDSNFGNNQASLNTTTTPRYDLTITKTDSVDPITPGSIFSYTILVTNSGPSDAQNVVVTDTLPAGLTIESVNSTGTVNQASNVVSVTFTSFPAGSSQSIVINVASSGTVSGILSNTAIVQALNAPSNQETNPANNAATETTTVSSAPTVDLSVSMTDTPDPVPASSLLRYNVTIRNLSTISASDVSAILTLDPELSFSAITGTFDSFIPTGSQVTVSIDNILGGATITFAIDVFVASSASGSVTSSIEIFSTPTDPNSINNQVSVNTVVGAAATRDVGITQTTSSPFADPGQPITYILEVTNNSNVSVAGVQVQFNGSADTGINSVVLSSGSTVNPASPQFTIDIGTMSAGQIITITVNAIVSSNATSAIANSVSVSVPNGDDDSSNDTTGGSLPLQLTLGLGTRGITATDFDGDDDTDLVAINEFSNDLVLLSNSGNTGFFTVQDRLPLAGRPRSIVSANDEDGSVVAVADVGTGAGPGGLFVYKKQALTRLTVGNGPVDVAIEDFNEDGVADFAVLTLRSGKLELVLGGTTSSVEIADARNPVAVAAADFNDDGHADIVISSSGFNTDTEGSLSVYLGDGTGKFTAFPLLSTIQGVADLAVAQLDGTGSDEVIAVTATGQVLVYSYTPGQTQPLALKQTYNTDPDLSAIHVADVNGDERSDLLVTNLSDDSLSVYVADTLGQLVLGADISNLSNPSDVTTGDFDNDGRIEMITTSYFVKSTTQTSTVRYSYSSLGTQLEFNLQSPSPSITSQLVTTPSIGIRLVETVTQVNPEFLAARTAASSTFDVNGDQRVTPLDALLVINSIQSTTLQASGETAGLEAISSRFDVNRDGTITPLDALLVINLLNQMVSSRVQAEPSANRISRDSEELQYIDQFFAELTG